MPETPDAVEPTRREEERLRLALGMIGDEAGRPEPAPHIARRTAVWRRRGVLAGALGAAAAVSVLLLVIGPPGGDGSPGSEGPGREEAGQGQTYQEYIACARMIADADIADVRRSPEEGRLLVTLDVREWIKPTSGAERVELDVVDPSVAGVGEPWREGRRALVVVPARDDLAADVFTGDALADQREQLEYYLPRAAGTECPSHWKNPPRETAR
ncbi:hypothetical protein V1L54_24015 [Streptomyces sp. TRM 70361]|uniref:hypothetical protein n=1 Tax=Streptomyces sp. TRM 70361 TaxID=3116553 RepID=UPI002E7BB7E9|nr:hypothetical protein [Streptomyces sp. TRM 70361]MEE1942430.1 hypothetical protein [Streptomyces sp. TRM 70361]